MPVFNVIKTGICAGLAFMLLAIAKSASAQDIGAAIEHSLLAHYTVDTGEYTLARAGDGYTYSVFGSRWGFLNQYDEDGHRIWQSPPLRVDGCKQGAMLASWGLASDGYYQLMPGVECPQGRTPLWLLLPDHSLVGVEADSAKDNRSNGEPAKPRMHWRLLASNASSPDEVTRNIMAQWGKPSLSTWFAETDKILSPQQIQIQVEPAVSVSKLRERHQQALRIWQQRAPGLDNSHRASKTLATLEPELSAIDPRSLPDADIGMLNDIGFWLQQEGGCDSSNDAIAVLETVIQRAPDRTPAYLNLAQAMQGVAWHCPVNLGLNVAMKENARLYCQRQGIEKIPGNIKAQLAEMLVVPALSEQACRPRLDLFRAVQARDLAGLQQALAAHPEDLQQASAAGIFVLHDAVAADWLEGTAALLDAGADPDDSVPRSSGLYKIIPSPLEQAIFHSNRDMVKLLLAADVELDPVLGKKPLLLAAGRRSQPAQQASLTGIVQDLLDAGARRYGIGDTDADGNTALMAAAGSGNLATAKLLLQYGKPSLINAINKQGQNALHHVRARTAGDLAIWQWLLEQGANLNQQDRWSKTPLMQLFDESLRDDHVFASLLKQALDHDPELELADNEGRRLLDYAVDDVDEPAVQALLNAGAAPCVVYNNGRSSMQNVVRRIERVRDYGRCRHDPSTTCPELQSLERIASLLNCPLPGPASQ